MSVLDFLDHPDTIEAVKTVASLALAALLISTAAFCGAAAQRMDDDEENLP